MRTDQGGAGDPVRTIPDTVPKAMTAVIRTFCGTLADGRPTFVRCRPDGDAVASECFDNVARKIARAGGSAVCGWAIWTIPGIYVEAEHHGVWPRRTGELIDVSPQPNLPRRILFLPDPNAVYDPNTHRTNTIAATSADPAAVEFVRLGNRRNEILGLYRAGGNRLALFNPSDGKELNSIGMRLKELSTLLLRSD